MSTALARLDGLVLGYADLTASPGVSEGWRRDVPDWHFVAVTP